MEKDPLSKLSEQGGGVPSAFEDLSARPKPSRPTIRSGPTAPSNAWSILKWMIPVLVLGSLGASLFAFSSGTSDVVRSVKSVITTPANSSDKPDDGPILTPGPDGEEVPVERPAGFAAGSLLLKTNFNRGLRRLRTQGSRLASLRVAADRIDASIATRDGRRKQVQVDWKGNVKVFSTSGPGFGQVNTFLIRDVFRAAPFRLSRSAAGRAKRPPESVDYLVAFHFSGLSLPGVTWSAFIKNGHQYSADSRGRITRQIN